MTTATITPTPTTLPPLPPASADDTRFCALYTRYQADVLHEVRHRLGALAAVSLAGISADDLAQEAWLRTWRMWSDGAKLNSLPDAAVVAYARRTVRHLTIDLLRYQQMRWRHGHHDMTDTLWQDALATLETVALDEAPEAALLAAESAHDLWRETQTVLRRGAHATPASVAFDLALLTALAEGEQVRSIAARLGLRERTLILHQWRMRRRLQRHLRARGQARRRGHRAGGDAGEG